MKLDAISLLTSYSMNLLIGIAGWIDDDESISFYMPLTLSLLSPCIYRLIKNFPLIKLLFSISIGIFPDIPIFCKNRNFGKCFRNICIKITYFI
jgi:hypothetical protein